MKTTITRLSCALLIFIMILSCTITAFAASVTFGTDTDGIEHNYVAYKIFQASTEYNGVLTDIGWADDIDGATIITLLAANPYFENVLSIDDVLEILTTNSNREDYLVAFADIVGDYAIENGTKITNFDNLEPGYYVFVDVSETTGENAVDIKSRFVLKVSNDNLYIPVKSDKPFVTKDILENGVPVKLNGASIGDEINYQIHSQVPNMTGYDKYFFIFHDTMSKGLTFMNNVVITLDGITFQPGEKPIYDNDGHYVNELAIGDYYIEISDEEDGPTFLTIVIFDMLKYTAMRDADIVITYSAILNENAVIDNPGNPNEVYLEYSNDPTYNYTDDNNKQGPTGVTPSSKVKTFTTGIEINKVDGATREPLTGAIFEITGTNLNTVRFTDTNFVEDPDGTYYELVDGTFTQTDPNGDGIDPAQYVDPSKKYKKVIVTTSVEQDNTNKVTLEVDESGNLLVEGLAPGTYTIKEIKAPNGYNLLKKPIEIIINAVYDTETDEVTFTATKDNEKLFINENHRFEFYIENNKGSSLPETGGIGRFFLLGVGIISMLAGTSIITIYYKKRNVVIK